jgi:hypothetical protein
MSIDNHLRVTLIGWFRPLTVLPDDEILVMTSRGDGEMTLGYCIDGDWFSEEDDLVSAPDWWAHLPDGVHQ